jgi:hypothetical protein
MESVLSGRDIPEGSKLLGAKNYAIWSFKVRTVLQGEHVWHVVDPITTPISESASSSQSGSGSALRSRSGSDTGTLTTPDEGTSKEKQLLHCH